MNGILDALQLLLQFFQFDCHFLDRLITFVRLLSQAPAYDVLQLVRRYWVYLFYLRSRRIHDLVQRIQHILTLEGSLSGGRFKEETAEREDV